MEENLIQDNFIEENLEPISVYVKANVNKEIIEVGSSIFLTDFTGWIKVDEGYGDRYAHAQSQYFKKPLIEEDGNANYFYDEEKGGIYERNR